MTHKDVSESTQQIMDSFAEQSLLESVISCIGNVYQKDDKKKSESIIDYVKSCCESIPKAHYLEESTSGDKKDPHTRLDSQLRNGWQTGGGFRLPLTEIPAWDKYLDHSRNVRYKIHSWVMLDTILVVDSLSDNSEHLELAIDIADDWIQKYVVTATKDDFAWYDMAVGQRATKLSYMLRRLIEMDYDGEIIFRFILASHVHLSELLDKDRIAIHSNHGLFQMAGLLSLCQNLPWMKLSEGGTDFSEEILQIMIEEHFAEDGLHLEHSPDYHLYMVNHLQSLIESGWLSEKSESIFSLITPVLEAAEWMATPEHNVIPIGDTANNVKMTKRWAGYTGNTKIGCKFFPKGGLVINNSTNIDGITQLVFSAQFHSRQHKHADHLNVLYNFKNKPLLVDPGTFTYQYDIPERMYCESTRSHNTIEIDSLNYSRFRQDCFGSALTMVGKSDNCLITEGKVVHNRLISPAIPNNKIHSSDAINVNVYHRRMIVERPGFFLAIIDDIQSKDEHEFIPWYHLHPDLQTRRDTATKLAAVDEEGKKVCQIQCYDGESNPIDCVEIRGQTSPILQGWYSKNGRELIENTVIGYPQIAKSQLWVTVFDFKMGKTGKPYLRVGSEGRYLRFALTQDENKTDLKIKTGKDGTRIFELEVDSFEETVNLEYEEG